jgi:hypothetical protein
VLVQVSVGGCTLELEARGSRWARALTRLERDWQGQEPGPVAGRILFGSDPGPAPRLTPAFDEGPIRVWTAREAPYLEFENARIAMPDDQTVVVDGDSLEADQILDLALPLAIGWVLAVEETWVVHASGFVGQDAASPSGHGAVLVFGETGAGKSTTAVSALHAGWPVLSDDLVALRWAGEGRAMGVPRTVWVPEELGHVNGAGRTVGMDDLRLRRAVRPELASGWFSVRAVVLVEHGSEAATRVEPASGVDTLRVLWKAHFLAMIPFRLARWFPIAACLSRSSTWRLRLGTDPKARLGSTASALEALSASATCPPPP